MKRERHTDTEEQCPDNMCGLKHRNHTGNLVRYTLPQTYFRNRNQWIVFYS